MSVHITTPPIIIPPPALKVPPGLRDATTTAALRFLLADSSMLKQADAFDYLVAICWAATRPYFLRDRQGSVTVENTPQFDNVRGERTGYNIRKEGTASETTRRWIQEWLLNILAPYRGVPEADIVAAADAGKFRYLGLWCLMRLKTIVYRQHKRESKDALDGFVTLTDYNLGTDLQSAPSALGHTSFEQVLADVENASRVVEANAGELERLGLLVGLRAYLSVAEHVIEPRFEGRATRAMADLLADTERAASDYKHEFHRTMDREMRARNPLIQAIIKELTEDRPWLVEAAESDEELDNQRLLREARELMSGK
jgi:hypothetical protein